MEQFLTTAYQWTVNNPFIWGVVSTIVIGAIALILAPEKCVKIGFTMSQYARRFFGDKGERRLEIIMDKIEEGLHSDDKVEVPK